MASTKQPFIRNLFRGVNNSVGRHQLSDGEVWMLENFRPFRGKLCVTPSLVEWFTLTNLSSEASQTSIKFLQLVRNLNSQLRYLIINHKTARYVDPSSTSTQVQIPVVIQTAKPNNATVTGECLLYGHNVTDFAATNDEIEVEIDTTTTFKWRRNAGSWTMGVAIAAEVALGVNGLKVSFQGSGDGSSFTGYTVGNNWKWKRSWNHPYTGADSTTDKFPFSSAVYNKDIYVGGVERNIMRVRDDFLTSVGYTRAYGKYVGIFANHLIVGQYASGVYDGVLGVKDSYDAASTPFKVGWSHLENPDQFFSTDVNEADEIPFPQQAAHDYSNVGITGMGELNDQWFVYLPDSVKVGTYVGLPAVMQFRTAHAKIGNLFPAGLVVGARGHYFIGRDDVYCFTGTEFRSIGQKVIDRFKSQVVPITDSKHLLTSGYYDAERAEVVFTYWRTAGGNYQARQMVYQEKTGEWFFRNLPSSYTSATDIYTQAPRTEYWGDSIYGGSGVVYRDWRATDDITLALVDDAYASVTPAYTIPTIHTGLSDYGHRHAVKEIDTLFVDFNYLATNNCYVGLGVFKSNLLIRGDGSYTTVGSYLASDTTNKAAWFTFAKQVGRWLGYRFTLGNGEGAVSFGELSGYEEQVYGIPNQTEK